MRLLLDTHVLVWAAEDDPLLGPKTRKLLTEASHELFASPVSAMELSRLSMLRRIMLSKPLADWWAAALEDLGCQSAALGATEAIQSYQLPGNFHKDPADRVLVATARSWNLTLLTADETILRYVHVKHLDARK